MGVVKKNLNRIVTIKTLFTKTQAMPKGFVHCSDEKEVLLLVAFEWRPITMVPKSRFLVGDPLMF